MSDALRSALNRPRTSQRWPRLSQSLPHPHPQKCAACGKWDREEILSLWQEHDEQDKPETRYVLLCRPCGEKLIEPHVRLHSEINRNTPAPGAMEICGDCRFRDGTWCAKAKGNGGPGVVISAAKPSTGFWDGAGKDGRRTGGVFRIYGHPPTACSEWQATQAIQRI